MIKRPLLFAALLCLGAVPVHAQQNDHPEWDLQPELMGGQTFTKILVDRLEARHHDGDDVLLWDAEAWYGGDINKLRLKTEGEADTDAGDLESAEVQALYSRAVTSFFDMNVGVRHDIKPDPDRTHLVLGLQGLAPYWFELDGNLFLSNKGDLTGRLEAEYEFLITQSLILQPRAELNFSAQDVPELGIGSGPTQLETGVRLRYEIVRQFGPYIGVSWEKSFGDTADFARAEGEDPNALVAVAGVRLWF